VPDTGVRRLTSDGLTEDVCLLEGADGNSLSWWANFLVLLEHIAPSRMPE